MKLSAISRMILACRRHTRTMERKGYERIRGPWDIDRGGRTNYTIVDAVVDPGGKDVWVKCVPAGGIDRVSKMMWRTGALGR
jgi:hypothetical protein